MALDAAAPSAPPPADASRGSSPSGSPAPARLRPRTSAPRELSRGQIGRLRRDSLLVRSRPSIRVIDAEAPTACGVECNHKGWLNVRLFTKADAPDLREFGAPEVAASIARAFRVAIPEGLSQLVITHLGARLPAGLSFLREYSLAMHNHWVLAYRASGTLPGEPPGDAVEAWAALGRDVPGLERLRAESLRDYWENMARCMRHALVPNKMTIVDFLMQYDAW